MFDKRKSLTTGNGAKKRQKLDHEELIPSSFEEDLALIESLEKESQSTNDGSQQDEFFVPKRFSTSNSNKWQRPNLPNINPEKDSIVFQQFEVDHYTGWCIKCNIHIRK